MRHRLAGTFQGWTARDWQGMAVGIMILGAILAGFSGFNYYLGQPGHNSETTVGPQQVPEMPPGLLKHRFGIFAGIGMAAAGGIAVIGLEAARRFSKKLRCRRQRDRLG